MATKDHSQAPDTEHLENGGTSHRGSAAHQYVDHRENDDRADEAKGRYAEAYNKHYWLSVNYIGSLFAIGMAFMVSSDPHLFLRNFILIFGARAESEVS